MGPTVDEGDDDDICLKILLIMCRGWERWWPSSEMACLSLSVFLIACFLTSDLEKMKNFKRSDLLISDQCLS